MTKVLAGLAIAASAVAFAPQPVAAASCTQQYTKCLNDTWFYTGELQRMADLECSAEYAGCVAKKWLPF